MLHQLKHGQEADVRNTLAALPAQLQTAGLPLSDLLQRDIAYFQTQREHPHYQALAAKGSPIGTGAMKSTCGQLQTRVKRIGQFWKPVGLGNPLALKAALQNKDWYQAPTESKRPNRLRACLKQTIETRCRWFGVPPLGGFCATPPKGGTPNRVFKQALRRSTGKSCETAGRAQTCSSHLSRVGLAVTESGGQRHNSLSLI
ncbi:MAG: hypothetical protein WCQ21_14160 [Verrucomicrobiota bacterium]